MGPNVSKLIAAKMATAAIPPGGDFTDGLRFLLNSESMKESARAASTFIQNAIEMVRLAGPEWSKATDEEIAAEILKKLEVQTSGESQG